MPKRLFFKHEKTIATVFLGVGLLLLAACGTTPASTVQSTPTSTGTTVQKASAALTHSPSGKATLSWEPATHLLTVSISLTGLVPKSTHPAHIHAGSCNSAGKTVVFPLTDVVADATGVGTSETKVRDVTGGIPANGWYLNVHNGPNLTPASQYMPIICADITNPKPALDAAQMVDVPLLNGMSPDQAASGTVQLSLSAGHLTVVLALKGLTPGSVHPARINAGSCASQGNKVLYSLNPVTANTTGMGSSTTVVPDVASLPASGWYVDVHFGPDTTSQTGADPIACGDVSLSH